MNTQNFSGPYQASFSLFGFYNPSSSLIGHERGKFRLTQNPIRGRFGYNDKNPMEFKVEFGRPFRKVECVWILYDPSKMAPVISLYPDSKKVIFSIIKKG